MVIRKNRQVQVTETVIMVSTGAANTVPIARVTNIAEAIRRLQDNGIVVRGVEIDGTRVYNEVNYRVPVAFVVGSEGRGLSRFVKERCAEVVQIPMQGKSNSLNASVAAGIMLFEVLRQRR